MFRRNNQKFSVFSVFFEKNMSARTKIILKILDKECSVRNKISENFCDFCENNKNRMQIQKQPSGCPPYLLTSVAIKNIRQSMFRQEQPIL